MAVKLSRLCRNVEKTYGMKLLAGSNGLDNYVRWVHIVEDKEVPDFLQGNELIFTTGIAKNGQNWALEFVKGCHKTGAVGVVFNLGPYISAVPPQVVVYCEENGFPLYTVPWEVHLIDLTYEFCHRIIANEEHEMGLATALKNAIFSPIDENQYKPILERKGFHKDAKYTVVAIRYKNYQDSITESEAKMLKFNVNKLLSKLNVLSGIFYQEKKLIAVLHNCDQRRLDTILKHLYDAINNKDNSAKIAIGVGPELVGYQSISDGYYKAISTLKISSMHDIGVMSYEKLGIYKLIISISDKRVMREFYNENLDPLIKFDEKNKTDYVETLKIYLDHDSSVQRVAQITDVHRNTVNYKVKKIKEILNTDLNSDDKLKIILAYYIKDFI